MRLRTRVAAAALAMPLTLGLAACDGDKQAATGSQPTPVISKTPTPTLTPPAPSKVAPAVAHLNPATFVPAMNAAFTKQQSWRLAGLMTVRGEPVMAIRGFQQTEPLAMSMEMGGPVFQGRKAVVIILDGKLYLSVPGMTPTGKFVKVEAKKLSDPALANVRGLMDGADPTRTFKSVGNGLVNVKYVRSEPVSGEKLDRYLVTVKTAAVAKLQGKKLPAGTPKTLPFTVWMDKEHLLRKMSFELAGVKMTVSMTEFNQPITIKAPPADKIVR